MKATAMIVMAIAIEMTAQGEPRQRLTVYMQDHTAVGFVTMRAQVLAAEMFAGVGITLEWHHGRLPASAAVGAIAVELADCAPLSKPGILAYAMPYEGVHVKIFNDRIAAFHPNIRSQVLAHVLVHEITHLLQGISRHSETGIMKAVWTDDDYCKMRFKSLAFAQEDISLISHGIEARANRLR